MIRMKAITPTPMNTAAFERNFRWVVESTLKVAETQFAKTYATWTHKPKWNKTVKVLSGSIEGGYYTEDQIYVWVSGGTKGPYKIPKGRSGKLAFPSGYKAKTVPGPVYSRGGGSFGPMVFIHGQVTHPGIKAREFDKGVAKFTEPWFRQYGNVAMKRAAKESKHAI